MAVGSLQELIIDCGWSTVGGTQYDGYLGEGTWGTRNSSELWGKLMVLEDGFGLDITNQILQSEYKHGTLDPAEIRRIGMECAGSCNIHMFPDFARLLLDMCMHRDSTGESHGYTMLFNSPLGGTELYGGGATKETRYIEGAKVNTFTIAASNDSQEVVCNMEMIAKKVHYTSADWTRDRWIPKSPYIFIDGDVFFRPYDAPNLTSPLSPFSPWATESPFTPVSEWVGTTVQGFSIEGNNNLTPGPYKRDGLIQSLRAGRLQLNGSFTIDYENSGIDWYMLENFSSGELVLNFLNPGSTGYAVTKGEQGANTITVTTPPGAGTFNANDVIIVVGTYNGTTVSEVATVEGYVNGTGVITIKTFGDTLTGGYPYNFYHGWRFNWPDATAPKVYNYAMQLWIPTFKITDSPKTGAPTETQIRAINFQVSQPDVTDDAGNDESSSYKQIQYAAPCDVNPADRSMPSGMTNYFEDSVAIGLDEDILDGDS